MSNLRAVILHRHVLFRDLIELELRDLGPFEIGGSTNDPEIALEMLHSEHARALVVESAEGFIDRPAMLRLFCRAAQEIPEFVLISADLATSEIEIMRDSIAHDAHLAGLKPLLGVSS